MVPGGWGSQISKQSAHEGGKFVSPKHRPPLPPGNIPGAHFCWRLSRPQGHMRPEGLCQWNIPVTASAIEPATFWLVMQCLNHLRHRVLVAFLYVLYVPPISSSLLNYPPCRIANSTCRKSFGEIQVTDSNFIQRSFFNTLMLET
jgi:hypothetical protein